MKIVDSGDKDKYIRFSELSWGDVFTVDEEVYLKSSYEDAYYAVDLKTGSIHSIFGTECVTPLPNAELHLNN